MTVNRRRLILGLYVLALIVITEFVNGRLEPPAWPAFVAWGLLLCEYMSSNRTPHSLIGATIIIGGIIGAPSAAEAAH